MDSELKFRLLLHSSVSTKEKRELEGYLGERPLNDTKLAKFASNSIIPETYRTLVWKVLLNIAPRYAESHDYVKQQQELMYEDLWRTLRVLRLRGPIVISNGERCNISNGSNVMVDVCIPEPEHYLLLWLISEGKLLHNPMAQLQTYDHQKFIIIAHRFSTFFDHPVEFFTFYSALWSLLRKNKQSIISASNDAIALVKKRDDALHLHLLRIGLFSDNILTDHCFSLFCDIFPESAVEKILDKVIAGAFQILTFVIVSLFNQIRSNLFSIETVAGVRDMLLQLRKEQADMIVQRALNHWNTRLNENNTQTSDLE